MLNLVFGDLSFHLKKCGTFAYACFLKEMMHFISHLYHAGRGRRGRDPTLCTIHARSRCHNHVFRLLAQSKIGIQKWNITWRESTNKMTDSLAFINIVDQSAHNYSHLRFAFKASKHLMNLKLTSVLCAWRDPSWSGTEISPTLKRVVIIYHYSRPNSWGSE